MALSDLMQPQQHPGGFSLERMMTSPLFMMGASVLGAPNVGQGLSQGAMTGMKMRQFNKAQEQQDAWKGAFSGQGGGGMGGLMQGMPPELAPLIGMMGPEKGAAFLADRAAKQADEKAAPWWVQPDNSVHPAMRAKTEAGAMRTTINNSPETAYDKHIGESDAKDMAEARKYIFTGTRDIGTLRVMDKALDDPNLYTGTGGDAVQALKKGAQTLFGVDVKGVGSGEVVQNIASMIATDMRDRLPGPMSDADRRFLVEMAPNLSKTREGNRAIIQLGILNRQYHVDRSKAMNAFAGQNKGRWNSGLGAEATAAVDAQYADKFAEFMAKIRSLPVEPRVPPTAGTPLDQIRSKYGLD